MVFIWCNIHFNHIHNIGAITKMRKIIYAGRIWKIFKENTRTLYLRRFDNQLRSVIKIRCSKNSMFLREIEDDTLTTNS